jgi:hypothetical protein
MIAHSRLDETLMKFVASFILPHRHQIALAVADGDLVLSRAPMTLATPDFCNYGYGPLANGSVIPPLGSTRRPLPLT